MLDKAHVFSWKTNPFARRGREPDLWKTNNYPPSLGSETEACIAAYLFVFIFLTTLSLVSSILSHYIFRKSLGPEPCKWTSKCKFFEVSS